MLAMETSFDLINSEKLFRKVQMSEIEKKYQFFLFCFFSYSYISFSLRFVTMNPFLVLMRRLSTHLILTLLDNRALNGINEP